MCGIFGAFFSEPVVNRVRSKSDEILNALHVRGPDGSGSLDLDIGLMLHTRLSFEDHTENGAQPFVSDCGKYALVFNGEIYNHKELAAQLEAHGVSFRSKSDSEVLLMLLVLFGERGLNDVEGMYGFAFYDSVAREVIIGRDSSGMKPLYYHWSDSRGLIFSSLQSLVADSASAEKSEEGRLAFLLFGYYPLAGSMFSGVSMLLPGQVICFNSRGKVRSNVIESYEMPEGGFQSIELDLVEPLRQAVGSHLQSSVRLGSFLSGGLDSSLLSVLAANEASDLFTVSIAFSEQEWSEKKYQDIVAAELPSAKIQQFYEFDNYRLDFPEYLDALDFPILDGFNTYVACKLAKSHGLKAVLSGQGADELFFGYKTFAKIQNLSPAKAIAYTARFVNQVGPFELAFTAPIFTGTVLCFLHSKMYFTVKEVSDEFGISKEVVKRLFESVITFFEPYRRILDADRLKFCTVLEAKFRMASELLVKDDHFSMTNSIEIRSPFLSPSFKSCVWMLSSTEILSGVAVGNKGLLQRTAHHLVPDSVVYRKKSGFSVPYSKWLPKVLDDYDESRGYMQNLAKYQHRMFYE